jgi:hypothetical protein
MAFECICGKPMQVENVTTTNYGKTKCTNVYLKCEHCNFVGARKVWWDGSVYDKCLYKTTSQK